MIEQCSEMRPQSMHPEAMQLIYKSFSYFICKNIMSGKQKKTLKITKPVLVNAYINYVIPMEILAHHDTLLG